MNDLEFVRKCCQGDKQTWDSFVEKYSRLIYNYIHSAARFSGLSLRQEDIDDIFQDTFAALSKDNFRKLKSFQAKNGCSFATWLRQVTVNLTFDFLRGLKKTVSLEEGDEGSTLKEILADSSPQIGELLQQDELLKGLKECIEVLGADDKFFVELHINRGIALEVLKGYFRISRGAIDMKKARIIERLRDCFRSKGFFKLD